MKICKANKTLVCGREGMKIFQANKTLVCEREGRKSLKPIKQCVEEKGMKIFQANKTVCGRERDENLSTQYNAHAASVSLSFLQGAPRCT